MKKITNFFVRKLEKLMNHYHRKLFLKRVIPIDTVCVVKKREKEKKFVEDKKLSDNFLVKICGYVWDTEYNLPVGVMCSLDKSSMGKKIKIGDSYIANYILRYQDIENLFCYCSIQDQSQKNIDILFLNKYSNIIILEIDRLIRGDIEKIEKKKLKLNIPLKN